MKGRSRLTNKDLPTTNERVLMNDCEWNNCMKNTFNLICRDNCFLLNCSLTQDSDFSFLFSNAIWPQLLICEVGLPSELIGHLEPRYWRFRPHLGLFYLTGTTRLFLKNKRHIDGMFDWGSQFFSRRIAKIIPGIYLYSLVILSCWRQRRAACWSDSSDSHERLTTLLELLLDIKQRTSA